MAWASLCGPLPACTTILVGKAATADGSVLMATSCDGDIMGRVFVAPARTFATGKTVPMYYDFPAPETWREHVEIMQRGYTEVGQLRVDRTYHCILAAGHLADSVTGGMNEHGVSMGIEYMGMRPELVNEHGRVSTCSNHWTSSLICNGLMQATTAREAIELMGQMAEEYGFTYYWAPTAGCAIPVIDRDEAWLMEVFGPGADWRPGGGKPGAVWCAQRIPDNAVSCSANRSRIAKIDLTDRENFLGSSNIYSLAEELGLWNGSDPFVWREVYGVAGDRTNSLREWAALDGLAADAGLSPPASDAEGYPFAVNTQRPVTIATLKTLMRDCYEDTEHDVTAHPAFHVNGEKSPLARPMGSPDLFELIDVKPERCIGSETSGYVYISQSRRELPAPIAGCMWFTLGPSYTSCLAPIYSGVTKIPEPWSRLPDFTRIDRSQVQWKFQLVEDLTNLRFQDAIRDVRRVFQPAEEQLLTAQERFEAHVMDVMRAEGATAASELVTDYTESCLKAVDQAYGELVDYLMFKYLYSYSDAAPPGLPEVQLPTAQMPGE